MLGDSLEEDTRCKTCCALVGAASVLTATVVLLLVEPAFGTSLVFHLSIKDGSSIEVSSW